MISVVGLAAALSCVVTPELRRAAPDLDVSGRPILSGPVMTVDSADGLFRIHYTMEGGDALGADADEIIAWTFEGLSRTHAAFVVEDGWPNPRNDGTLGGNARLDLYLRGLDINGYAHAQDYGDTRVCWMEVDPSTRSLGRETYESIVGHEFHHCLQFTVADTRVGGSFPYEGTSTYAQYLLFEGDPAVDLARQVLWQIRLVNAGWGLAQTGDRFEYAGMIWFKFLLDHAGRIGVQGGSDRKKLLQLWEAMNTAASWNLGHDAVLPSLFGLAEMDTAATRFAEWNLFACQLDDGRHYDPTTLACGIDFTIPVPRTTAFPANGTSASLGRWGSGYAGFTPDCTSGTLKLTVTANAPLRAQAVEIGAGEQSQTTEAALAAGESHTFTVSGWNRRKSVVLVGTNLDGAQQTFTWSAATEGTYTEPTTFPPVLRLKLDSGDRIVLAPGQKKQVKALAEYDTCQDGRDVSGEVLWHSTDEAVVTIEDGELHARGVGFAEIFATLGDLGSVRVFVDVDGGLPSGCAVAAGWRGDWIWFGVVLALLGVRRRRA
jgi:hypothetical protein